MTASPPAFRAVLNDLKAAMTMVRLHDAATTAVAWEQMNACLGKLLSGGWFPSGTAELVAQVPSDVPHTLWRCDRGLWEATLYFVVEADTAMMITLAGVDDLSVCIRSPDGTRTAGRLGRSAEIEQRLDTLLQRHAQGDGAAVGSDTVFALWVARGYDTMQRVAQLRQLAAEFGPDFRPRLAINAVGNLLDPDVALPFAREALRIGQPGVWRREISTDINLCECLKYEYRRQNAFHEEILRFIRVLAQQDGDSASGAAAEADARFSVFISIEAEKRQMTNQADFFLSLLTALQMAHGPLDVFVNGMTGNIEGVDHFSDIRDFEASLIAKLAEALPEVRFTHMHNWTFATKAISCRRLDFYVAPIGTAMLIPLALEIPGVVYNSPDMLTQFLWFLKVMPSRTVAIDRGWTHTVEGDLAMRKYAWGWQDKSRMSYALDVEQVVGFCLERSRAFGDGAQS